MQTLSITAMVTLAVSGLMAGCTTPTTVKPVKPWAYSSQNTGKVVLVNEEMAYVVLETVVEPEAHQEVDVTRKGRNIGRLKVTDRRDAPYVLADILSGSLEVGDAVLLRPKGLGDYP